MNKPDFQQILTWVQGNAGCHFLEQKGKYTCHTTLGQDIYELGETKGVAQYNLAERIEKSKELYGWLKDSTSFRSLFSETRP